MMNRIISREENYRDREFKGKKFIKIGVKKPSGYRNE
jgi:hypothetical protein